MDNNKFDYLIPGVSQLLSDTFMQNLALREQFKDDVETAPLQNMTIAVFIGSLITILDAIKKSTDGEERLISNIELAKKTLIEAIETLPFVTEVRFV